MLGAPIPEDEDRRLDLLRACRILYTPAEAAFDDVAKLAAEICGTEIALITLVDSDYQWFKSRVGVEQEGTSRDLSFCGHCIHHHHPLVVEDTLHDTRFADNPLVVGPPNIRFYAGVPLILDRGSAIGALSVADPSPRSLTPRQLKSLELLAQQIARELRLRRDLECVKGTIPPVAPNEPLAIGSSVGGRWRVVRALGRGAIGAVYEARDENGERAAIKVLLPQWRAEEHVLERFAREARVLLRLNSPHVGRVLDVGNIDLSQGGHPFIALEFLEGMDLDRWVERHGPVPFRQALAWGADACEGLAAAHGAGIVHRDLKPSNVFLADTEEGVVVKVIDFGIAAELSERALKLTTNDTLLGSPAYMAPEQMVASADADARSDIWSMGVLLYELITVQVPFAGTTPLEMFANAMSRPPLPLRAHMKEPPPPEVEAILLRCLRKKPSDRFQTMHELAARLRACAEA